MFVVQTDWTVNTNGALLFCFLRKHTYSSVAEFCLFSLSVSTAEGAVEIQSLRDCTCKDECSLVTPYSNGWNQDLAGLISTCQVTNGPHCRGIDNKRPFAVDGNHFAPCNILSGGNACAGSPCENNGPSSCTSA